MRGRFAPSPTGDLHLGNARTALLSWLQVRSAGGRFVLRVEDLDVGRVRKVYLTTQMIDLRWLGLDWDEGPDVGGPEVPYLQSEREGLYAEALERLSAAGRLYGCFCSRKEIAAAASAPHGDADEGPAYPGTCLRLPTGPRPPAPSAVRFRVPPGEVRFRDLLQGEVAYTPRLATGDFVVRRKDGVAAYQLAVVVDDHAMRITDVLRGADLLPSTARQLLLYRQLGFDSPRWAHVPLLLGADGERLSKRHGAVSLRELREAALPPERVVGWLASTCQLASSTAELLPADLVPSFDLARIPRKDTAVELPDWARR